MSKQIPRLVGVVDVSDTEGGPYAVLFDAPVMLHNLRYPHTPAKHYKWAKDIPPEATHWWYAEDARPEDCDRDDPDINVDEPNLYYGDALGAYVWGQWVLSMQDYWEKRYAKD